MPLYISVPSPFVTAISFAVVIGGAWLLLKALVRLWAWFRQSKSR